MGLYVWHLTRQKAKMSVLEFCWKKFQNKMKKRGVILPLHSITEGSEILKRQNSEVQDVWQELIEASFKSHNQATLNNLKKKIQSL